MKVLLIHSDHMEYNVTKAIKNLAEETDIKEYRMEECLTVFCTVESRDREFMNDVLERSASVITETARSVKTGRIMIYPYAHLSSDLGKPSDAVEVLKALELRILEEGFEVKRSPFGWYKAFDIRCKGHPLSELSREIRPWTEGKKKVEESKALKAEKETRSEWFVLDTEGGLHPVKEMEGRIEGYDLSGNPNLKKFLNYEISKSRAVTEEPPHVRSMRALELADYEPGSDPGNLRFYPKGRLVKSLLERYVTGRVKDYGGMEIESPIMYDLDHPSLKSYMHRFPARQYTIETPDKKVFLRFAACFGQFLMAHDATISYKQMPIRLYELTRYSFRVEQRGELSGLRRLRAFTMPDCHALCAGMDQAKEEMMIRFHLAISILAKTGFRMPEDLQMAVRVTKDFYEENREFVHNMAREYGQPIVVEMWRERFFYFLLKYEFNFVDAMGKASALTTDQIDIENGERYDITYTDPEGNPQHPFILHLSPSGAIERNIYALLEKAHLDSLEGEPASLPYWLSPTQLRLIPVSEEYMRLCQEIVAKLPGVRADIEDSDRTVGRKIRDAEKEWIPYIAVIGEKEAGSGKLTIRKREAGKPQVEMTLEELTAELSIKQGEMPWDTLGLPIMVSKRPKFVG
ncbi:MAG: threonine--tRNA ligase [Candidatus Thermoplasmatota archaeon]|nr:threonine--tRNA ligase [Candidatus Thermoplasmatota archaeon]